MASTGEKAAAGLLVVCGVPVVMTLAYIYSGWVFVMLWGWFVVPAFGLKPLTIPLAVGLSCIVTLLAPHIDDYQRRKETSGFAALTPLLRPLILLVVGWIVQHFWMP